MNLMKRNLGFLSLLGSLLLVSGSRPRGVPHEQTSDQIACEGNGVGELG
jgi:hypothetical protein